MTMKPHRQTRLPSAECKGFHFSRALRSFAHAEAPCSSRETAVEDSSGQALSAETDRLPVISALARAVAEATGDWYLAGPWRNNLLAGLRWFQRARHHSTRRPRPHHEYIAPTWSWASLGISPVRTAPKTRVMPNLTLRCTSLGLLWKVGIGTARCMMGSWMARGKACEPESASFSKYKPP